MTTAAPLAARTSTYHTAIAAAARAIGPRHRDAVTAFLAQVTEQAATATTALRTAN
jgi:hypothetical protein